MKRVFVIIIAALIALPAHSQTRSINFEEPDFARALAKARQTGRNLFVDCYTTWCGPCKRMAREVFTNDAVADYFNATFVNVKLDMEKEGREPLKDYPVSGYPTFLILDGEGKLLHKMSGYYDPENFLRGVKLAAPEFSLSALTEKFSGGDRTPQTIEALMFALKGEGDYETMAEILSSVRLFGDQTTAKEPVRWRIFANFQSDLQSPDARFFVENVDLMRQAHGDVQVDNKLDQLYSARITDFCYWEVRNPGTAFPAGEFDGFIEELQGQEFDKAAVTLSIALTERLMRQHRYDDAVKLMETVAELRVMNRMYETVYLTMFVDKLLSMNAPDEAVSGLLSILERRYAAPPSDPRMAMALSRLAERLGDSAKASLYREASNSSPM